jgi:methyl-accepting chemotaxis protein
MAQGIQRQHEQSNYIAISTEEMSKTIEETAKNTTLVARQSAEARDEAALGGVSLQKMIDAVNHVNHIVKKSADSVAHLNDSSEQISAMSAAIAEIADQTNLLALNAAIEAARAGDQGRGFAVVADEVRKLAERTQQATKEISSLVNAIQKDTHSVVITMKQGVQEVEQTHVLVQQTYDSLERIIDRTRSISDFITQLAVTSEEQHATSEDIAGNMGVMTMVVSQSASVSEQIANTSQTLNLMTLAVQSMLNTFRVEHDSKNNDQNSSHNNGEQYANNMILSAVHEVAHS